MILQKIQWSPRRGFEYRDKPGKHLERLLMETGDRNLGARMTKEDRLWAVTSPLPREKLSIFFQASMPLYTSAYPS